MPERLDSISARRAGQTIHRILIVDDHPIVVAGLTALIEAEADLEVCGRAESASEAMQAARTVNPELVIVDLSLGTSSGLELIKEFVRQEIVTLVVSMNDDPTWVERALAAGALGYVHKSVATSEVVEAIRRVMDGRLWVSENLSEQLLRRNLGQSVPGAVLKPMTSLTDRELEVFERIGRGLTTQQIAGDLHLSPKTIQTYRLRIKEKLCLESAAELSTSATRWVVEQSAR